MLSTQATHVFVSTRQRGVGAAQSASPLHPPGIGTHVLVTKLHSSPDGQSAFVEQPALGAPLLESSSWLRPQAQSTPRVASKVIVRLVVVRVVINVAPKESSYGGQFLHSCIAEDFKVRVVALHLYLLLGSGVA